MTTPTDAQMAAARELIRRWVAANATGMWWHVDQEADIAAALADEAARAEARGKRAGILAAVAAAQGVADNLRDVAGNYTLLGGAAYHTRANGAEEASAAVAALLAGEEGE